MSAPHSQAAPAPVVEEPFVAPPRMVELRLIPGVSRTTSERKEVSKWKRFEEQWRVFGRVDAEKFAAKLGLITDPAYRPGSTVHTPVDYTVPPPPKPVPPAPPEFEPILTEYEKGWPVATNGVIIGGCLNPRLCIVRLDDGREVRAWNTRQWYAEKSHVKVQLESAEPKSDPLYDVMGAVEAPAAEVV